MIDDFYFGANPAIRCNLFIFYSKNKKDFHCYQG